MLNFFFNSEKKKKKNVQVVVYVLQCGLHAFEFRHQRLEKGGKIRTYLFAKSRSKFCR